MQRLVPAHLLVTSMVLLVGTHGAAAAEGSRPAQDAGTAAPGTSSQKSDVAVGEVLSIRLPCSPATGFEWQVKSIDREIADPVGPAEFEQKPAAPGAVGVGGSCVLRIKGVAAGKTKATLVYRRPWENVEPAKTSTVDIQVLPRRGKDAKP